jgi:hypothetical protein
MLLVWREIDGRPDAGFSRSWTVERRRRRVDPAAIVETTQACRAVLAAAAVCITERVDSYPSRLRHAESKITSHSLKKGSIAADLDGPSMLTLLYEGEKKIRQFGLGGKFSV